MALLSRRTGTSPTSTNALGANPLPSDPQVPSPPADTVQCMAWSPVANYLAAGSWDNTVCCWAVQPAMHGQPQAMPLAQQTMGGPVLDTAWSTDGSLIFAACADKSVQMWNCATNQVQQVAAHEAPVKTVDYIPSLSCIMTGSWDRTLKFWDLRQPTPAAVFALPERCYAADFSGNLAAVVTADRKIMIYNLAGGPKEYGIRDCPLKMQIRCLTCFPSNDGFALGSVEGRVSIQYAEESTARTANFSFKCHRSDKVIYCVNDISFHPRYHTLATVGSDGQVAFWDKEHRNRLKSYIYGAGPITCGKFNADGSLFAYAVGYDWSMGYQGYHPNSHRAIYIHPTTDAEVQPKATTGAP